MQTYPIVLTHPETLRCVIVGGGPVAERKIRSLLEAGAAAVVCVSPTLTPQIAAWREAGLLLWRDRRFAAGDLDGAALVFAATDDRAVNAAVAAAARSVGALANIADAADAGDFHTVATVRRGAALVTISTGGTDPALAARLRRAIAAALDAAIDDGP